MQPRAYLKLSDISLEQMVEKLRAAAEPGELEDLSLSTISRHISGKTFPSPRLQDLYDKATDGALKPQDWVDLAREVKAKAREAEPEADAA